MHVVAVPDARALAAYREDPRLAEHAALREAPVVHTDLLVGEDGAAAAAPQTS